MIVWILSVSQFFVYTVVAFQMDDVSNGVQKIFNQMDNHNLYIQNLLLNFIPQRVMARDSGLHIFSLLFSR